MRLRLPNNSVASTTPEKRADNNNESKTKSARRMLHSAKEKLLHKKLHLVTPSCPTSPDCPAISSTVPEAIVRIAVIRSSTGQVLNVGSGCFVASKSTAAVFILTAAHVVCTKGFDATDEKERLQVIVAPMTGLQGTDVPPWRYLATAKSALLDAKIDLAVLLVDTAYTVSTTPARGLYSSALLTAVSSDTIVMAERDKSSTNKVIPGLPGQASDSGSTHRRARPCVIKVGPSKPCACPLVTGSLDLGDASAMAHGQELAVFGFPRGCLDTLTHGRASCDGFATAPNKVGWIVKSRAGCSDGDSGGPVVTSDGKVVGVVSQSSSIQHGAIDYFRPVNLAASLIATAMKVVSAGNKDVAMEATEPAEENEQENAEENEKEVEDEEEEERPEDEGSNPSTSTRSATLPGPSASFASRSFGFGFGCASASVAAMPQLLSHQPHQPSCVTADSTPSTPRPASISPVGRSVAEWRLRKASCSRLGSTSVDSALTGLLTPPPSKLRIMSTAHTAQAASLDGGLHQRVPKKAPPNTPSPVGRNVLLWRQQHQQQHPQ
jgi:hypothetical protein